VTIFIHYTKVNAKFENFEFFPLSNVFHTFLRRQQRKVGLLYGKAGWFMSGSKLIFIYILQMDLVFTEFYHCILLSFLAMILIIKPYNESRM